MPDLIHIIRGEMQRRQISAYELARRVKGKPGCSYQAIMRMARGETTPTAEAAGHLLDALECRIVTPDGRHVG